MKVAVLGSNSFSGSDFIDLLLEKGGYEILGSSRSPEKSSVMLSYRARATGNFRFLQADFNSDLETLVAALDDFAPEVVVNFAAQSEVGPSWQHPEHWFQTNTVSLAKLLIALKDRRYLARYIHISSPEVYGTCNHAVTEEQPFAPSTPYAASKAAADMLIATFAAQYRLPATTIRTTNVYGAHQQLFKIIPRCFIYLRTGRMIQLHGGGKAVKSFIHIRDASRGLLAVMTRGEIGALYHFSPDRGYEVREVVRTICDLLGRDFARVTEVVADRLGQDAAYLVDSSKARRELGWRPEVTIEEGLKGVGAWIDKNWDAIRVMPHEYTHRA
jgi:dTDP-glucose 4,6-dehydratase